MHNKRMSSKVAEKRNVLKGFGVLAVAAIVGKIIGAFYRIPLINILGADGIGLYQLVYPVFVILITLSSGGIATTMSKLISERRVNDSGTGVDGLVKTAFIVTAVISLIFSLAVYFAGGAIASLQGDSLATAGYKAIAPAIFVVGILSVLRGYYQGCSDMVPTALSQIVEQVVKLIFGLTFARLFVVRGVYYGAFGALLGVSVSEVISVISICVLSLKKRNFPKLFKRRDDGSFKRDAFEIIRVALPITLGACVMPITQFIDSMLVINLTSDLGDVSRTALYGIFTGPVSSLINLPVVLTIALGMALVPSISKSRASYNLESVKIKSGVALKTGFVFGVFCMLIFCALSKPIINILYPSLSAGESAISITLLSISSVSVLSLSLIQIYSALLQGVGFVKKPVFHIAAAAAVKLILDVLLLRPLGIYGAALSSIICYLTAFIMNAISWHRRFKTFNVVKIVSTIALSGVIISIPVLYLSYNASTAVAVLSVIPCAVLYFLMIIAFGVFTKDEYESMPFGNGLLRLFCKIGGNND